MKEFSIRLENLKQTFFSGGRPIRSKQLLNPVHASSKMGLNLQLKETADHRI